VSDHDPPRIPAGAPPIFVGVEADPGSVAQLVPAATVLVLRDGPEGIETLMLRRNSKLAFAGGMWVFPGGRIDDDDRGPDDADRTSPEALLAAARRAAVREAREEADLDLTEDDLVFFSHWTPPEQAGKRFETWFFATAVPTTVDDGVVVDGGEITDHAWMRPAEALRRRDELDIELSPPTWISLWTLLTADDAADALHRARTRGPEHFATRIILEGDDLLAIYDGDVGYESGLTDQPGPRHRLRMAAGGWVYERD
jgi:8-oxo-dGTP pyrophosphatase MutT (NUDIX family)